MMIHALRPAIAAAMVMQIAVIGDPPVPLQHSVYLPILTHAAPAWRTVFTAQGKPFTDAVSIQNSLYISQQDGVIFRDGVAWLHLPVNAAGEGGLNSLATDGRRLWAGYVSPAGCITVAEIVNGLPVVLADFGQSSLRHNAAGLLYTNGKLLFGIGDNENAFSAQSATLPNGKLWALDTHTGDRSAVARGLRNPWHIAQIGSAIYISDVGETKYEEVNIFTQGSNYAWPCYEAFEARVYDPELCDPLAPSAGSIAPALAYGRNMGRGIVGVAEMNGQMVYADFTGAVRAFNHQPVKQFDSYISKMTMAGGAVIVLTFAGGVAGVQTWH